MEVSGDGTMYELVIHLGSAWLNDISLIRNLCQALGLVSLYGCNVGLVWFYRKRQAEKRKLLRRMSQEDKKPWPF